MIAFTVPGVPVPQGSKTAYRTGARTVLVEASRGLRPWRRVITAHAQQAARESGWEQATGPLSVAVLFRVPAPKRPTSPLPVSRRAGDVDKLARAVLDGCTDAGLWVDDSQVVSLAALKRYGAPGVQIVVVHGDTLPEIPDTTH